MVPHPFDFRNHFLAQPQRLYTVFATTTINTQKMRVVIYGHLPYWIPTELPSLAILAMLAYPNSIKLVHGLLNQLGIVGKDTGCLGKYDNSGSEIINGIISLVFQLVTV